MVALALPPIQLLTKSPSERWEPPSKVVSSARKQVRKKVAFVFCSFRSISWSVRQVLVMIQLTRHGLEGNADLAELERRFEQSHVFRMPGLLHPDLIRFVSCRLETCDWITSDDGEIAREALPENPALASVLNFAANTSAFLDLMRRITRCHQITWFNGRVYRMGSSTDHFDSWHADLGSTNQDRLVGMSINLGSRPYCGGVFRLRDEASGAVLCELPNTGQGDGIFFRISPALKHIVTRIEGSEPKTAFAGWFRSGEMDYYADLRRPARAS
jgi:hypothetical protein